MAKDLKTTLLTVAMILGLVLATGANSEAGQQQFRRLAVKDYVDKMKAGWIGQMVGVGWAGPTEFVWRGEIIPEERMPEWKPTLVNQFHQDDLYVEMTFLRTLEVYGLDVSQRQAGIDFANSRYLCWHANGFGRENLRKGIAPPDSGHPEFNDHPDCIDYQIEADYAGLISPGLPNHGIRLGEIFGRLMNYGDGLYGGQFISGMYAEAFFESDPKKLVLAGLKCVPAESQFYECIADVIKWHEQYPDDWQATWKLVEAKYSDNMEYRRSSCGKPPSDFNIDAKINAAYIVIGMLYGKGDLDETIIISTRCGQDSDCNPSSAAGVLFTALGHSNLPDRFKSDLYEQGGFLHTPYSFSLLMHVCETLARQAVLREGGRIERREDGSEVFAIPIKAPRPGRLAQSWDPGPVANSRFTDRERALIVPQASRKEVEEVVAVSEPAEAFKRVAPGWMMRDCGEPANSGFRSELRGRNNVVVTHPKDKHLSCEVFRVVDIPKGKPHLNLTVGHHEEGDWSLVVKVAEVVLLHTKVGPATTKDGWRDISVDLSAYAGSKTILQLHNAADGGSHESAYWARIQIENDS